MWRTTSTRTVYENAWIRVREDEVVRPDGSPGIYGVVDVGSPAVFVVAVTDDDEVVFVSVLRYTVDGVSHEIPAGGTDGEEPLLAAQRELREETGLEAATWRSLGRVHSLNGVAKAPGEVFLATDLTEVGGAETEVEGITSRELVALSELPFLLTRGWVTDNETLGALLLALVELGRVG